MKGVEGQKKGRMKVRVESEGCNRREEGWKR